MRAARETLETAPRAKHLRVPTDHCRCRQSDEPTLIGVLIAELMDELPPPEFVTRAADDAL